MSTKIQLPWLRPDEQIGLGDAFKRPHKVPIERPPTDDQ